MKARLLLLLALATMMAVTASAQMGYMGHTIDQNLIFPHFAVGGGYITQMILMNPGQVTAVSGTLYFFNQDGTPLSVMINGNPVTQLDVNLPEGNVRYITLDPTSADLAVGWGLFEVSGGSGGMNDPHGQVFGSVVFTHAQGGITDTKVGVVTGRYQMGMARNIAIPILAGNGLNTGVAVANAGPSEATIAFRLLDENGMVVRSDATITPALPPFTPGVQTARFVTDLFPDVDFTNFQGYLELVTQQEGMVAAGLVLDNGLLTSIPVVMVPNMTTAPQVHIITNVGFTFSPASITINAGDTVRFTLASIHNAVEVSQATWDANGTTSNGGFSIPFGGGDVVLNTPGTYYYVCTVHASQGMKGIIIVQ